MAFNQQKIGLLPASHYIADAQWLNQQLGYLNDTDREKVCEAYSKAFNAAVNAEPLEHKQTNAGRFAANSRLRVYMAKRFAVFNK